MNNLWREAMHIIDHMGMQEWALVLAAMILVAIFSMRGFGSRS